MDTKAKHCRTALRGLSRKATAQTGNRRQLPGLRESGERGAAVNGHGASLGVTKVFHEETVGTSAGHWKSLNATLPWEQTSDACSGSGRYL